MKYLVLAAMIAFCQPARAQNLVQNFSFETGDFTSWTGTGDTTDSGVDNLFPSQGTFGAFFSPLRTIGGIEQSIQTIAGHTYRVRYDLMLEGGQGGGGGGEGPGLLPPVTFNGFEASFAGTIDLPNQMVDVAPFRYQTFQFLATASSATSLLTFDFRNDSSYWDLDNVRVFDLVPELDPSAALLPFMVALTALAGAQRRRRIR